MFFTIDSRVKNHERVTPLVWELYVNIEIVKNYIHIGSIYRLVISTLT
jgi:hypothetical protein